MVSGMSLSLDAKSFRDIAGVCEATRLTRVGEKGDSKSACFDF